MSSARARSIRLSSTGHLAAVRPDELGQGWVLDIAGVEQSHVDPADPGHIRHEYLRRIATALDAFRPVHLPVRILHLGAGALTLPRYLRATRPGSEQVVVEVERELPTLVLQALPLPTGTRLEVRIGDAREEVAASQGRHEPPFDAIVLDIFTGEESPPQLACREFYAETLDRLSADGLLIVNVGDEAGLAFFARQARALEEATAAARLPGPCTLTDASLIDLRREGNLVLLAGGALFADGLERMLAACREAGPHPATVLDPDGTAALAARALRS